MHSGILKCAMCTSDENFKSVKISAKFESVCDKCQKVVKPDSCATLAVYQANQVPRYTLHSIGNVHVTKMTYTY